VFGVSLSEVIRCVGLMAVASDSDNRLRRGLDEGGREIYGIPFVRTELSRRVSVEEKEKEVPVLPDSAFKRFPLKKSGFRLRSSLVGMWDNRIGI